MPSTRATLQVIKAARRQSQDLPLDALASRSGWSAGHVHRAFKHIVKETPKQYNLRLRLEQAAVSLATTGDRVVDVAMRCGFHSHEVFTRAFRRRFGTTPAAYRKQALDGADALARAEHAALVPAIGPCISLFGLSTRDTCRRRTMPAIAIEKKSVSEQPMLFVRRRVARHEVSNALGECFGTVFGFCMQHGLPIAGRPMARYLAPGPGLVTLEAGVVLAAPSPGEGEIEAATLPGGEVAFGIHGGPYDQLPETYAAIERWCEEQGLKLGGPTWWETYVTDPAEHPDPADWRTEICWPLAT